MILSLLKLGVESAVLSGDFLLLLALRSIVTCVLCAEQKKITKFAIHQQIIVDEVNS